jgi:hypothetical protein
MANQSKKLSDGKSKTRNCLMANEIKNTSRDRLAIILHLLSMFADLVKELLKEWHGCINCQQLINNPSPL